MAKHHKLWYLGWLYHPEHATDGHPIPVDWVVFPSETEGIEWIQQEPTATKRLEVQWACADCEDPRGGRMCLQCCTDSGVDPGNNKASYATS